MTVPKDLSFPSQNDRNLLSINRPAFYDPDPDRVGCTRGNLMQLKPGRFISFRDQLSLQFSRNIPPGYNAIHMAVYYHVLTLITQKALNILSSFLIRSLYASHGSSRFGIIGTNSLFCYDYMISTQHLQVVGLILAVSHILLYFFVAYHMLLCKHKKWALTLQAF